MLKRENTMMPALQMGLQEIEYNSPMSNLFSHALPGISQAPLADRYLVSGKLLGTGAYANVYQGTCKASGQPVAIKIIPRIKIESLDHPADERKLILTEMQLGLELRHEHCTGTTEVFENADKYVIIMELMGGGDLFEYLERGKKVCEGEVKCIMRQLLTGLHYMHSQNIGHFDIKAENVLLSKELPMTVKHCDYGISIDLNRSQPSCFKVPGMLRCTPGYGAPEVVRQQSCGLKADMWSMGVLLYFLLTGKQPFLGSSPQETANLMGSGKYDAGALAGCSSGAADLVARLLSVDTAARLSAAQALSHEWIKMNAQESAEPSSPDAGGCCGLFGSPYQGKAFRNPQTGRT